MSALGRYVFLVNHFLHISPPIVPFKLRRSSNQDAPLMGLPPSLRGFAQLSSIECGPTSFTVRFPGAPAFTGNTTTAIRYLNQNFANPETAAVSVVWPA